MGMKTSTFAAFFFLIAALMLTGAVADAAPVEVGNPGFPYSVPGSFLTVGRHEQGKYNFRANTGLWIRNVSTAWREDVCRSGFSENYDAKTGEARRDPAYTWTASAFLVLAHELEAARNDSP